MALLNYTSKIDADKSASEISKCLSRHGAQAVMTEYDEVEGYVKSLSFRIKLNENNLSFRLPVDWQPVYNIMSKGKKFLYGDRGEKQKSELKLQAVRTAWRIVKDWVEAQMALVETQMVTTAEVFLPYAVLKNGKTLKDSVQEDPQFLLN